MPLGNVERTERGFKIISFKDYYDEECSLQQSSIALNTVPGTSAIWLGRKNADKDGGSPRMHLSYEQVRELVGHLMSWLNTGSF